MSVGVYADCVGNEDRRLLSCDVRYLRHWDGDLQTNKTMVELPPHPEKQRSFGEVQYGKIESGPVCGLQPVARAGREISLRVRGPKISKNIFELLLIFLSCEW